MAKFFCEPIYNSRFLLLENFISRVRESWHGASQQKRFLHAPTWLRSATLFFYHLHNRSKDVAILGMCAAIWFVMKIVITGIQVISWNLRWRLINLKGWHDQWFPYLTRATLSTRVSHSVVFLNNRCLKYGWSMDF